MSAALMRAKEGTFQRLQEGAACLSLHMHILWDHTVMRLCCYATKCH